MSLQSSQSSQPSQPAQPEGPPSYVVTRNVNIVVRMTQGVIRIPYNELPLAVIRRVGFVRPIIPAKATWVLDRIKHPGSFTMAFGTPEVPFLMGDSNGSLEFRFGKNTYARGEYLQRYNCGGLDVTAVPGKMRDQTAFVIRYSPEADADPSLAPPDGLYMLDIETYMFIDLVSQQPPQEPPQQQPLESKGKEPATADEE